MNKTAAIRSQARRAVLVKAAIDPAQIAGALAMAGGGALGGSAVTDDDQSMLKRIGKGTLGAALGYGGYKLMTDPRWQQGLRNGVGTARNLIAGLLGKAQGAAKAAEARPTLEEQAFAAGFCKAAEAMGVDPGALYKEALPAWIGRAGRALTGGAKRFGQLLAGTGQPLAQANASRNMLSQVIDEAGRENGIGVIRRTLGRGLLRPAYAAAVYRGDFGREAMKELAKVHATRAGTAAGLYGAGKVMFGGGDNGGQA